jgi:hypothetical protein
MASGLCAALTGRTHGRTDQACKREENPCQLGAVHTWRKADIGRSRCLFWPDAIHPQQPHRLTSFDASLPIGTIGVRDPYSRARFIPFQARRLQASAIGEETHEHLC